MKRYKVVGYLGSGNCACFKCYFNTHVCLEDEFFACLLAVNSGPVDFASKSKSG